jgi:glycolate oxidase FAD binding subunit
VFECSADEAIRWVNEWGGKPLPLSGTCYHAGKLAVRLSGAAPAVDAAERKLGGAVLAEGDAYWRSVREQTHPHFAPATGGTAALWRLSVKPTAPYGDLGGDQLLEWGGALRWLVAGERTDAARIRAWAQSNGGHATLFRAADKSASAFHPLSEPLLGIHRRLKAAFDPAGVFNPGRLYADF